jgi:hypothetical protein
MSNRDDNLGPPLSWDPGQAKAGLVATGHSFSVFLSPLFSGRRFCEMLQAYFLSGWAFLLPYLATYLLYSALQWPVNPSHDGTSRLSSLPIPSLLHVYWMLHAIHAALAIVCMVLSAGPKSAPPGTFSFSANIERLRGLLPWFCLLLILWIPGMYLEWPSDPWEHLRRTNEWAIYDVVGSHSAGYKSFYFLSYSAVAWLPPKLLLPWMNVYYVACCLLLAWQYYRLALVVGLSRPWAFLFVTTNLVTFGNTCFSFYRYYGLSSTVFSQLGAVALTRIVLDACASTESTQVSQGGNQSAPVGRRCNRDWIGHLRAWWGPGLSVLALIGLIGFNHVQGLGIAMLGAGAVITWRLLQWRKSAAWWLLAGTLCLSLATVLGWPKHALVESSFRAGGWLSTWYGFNLTSLSSPAAARAELILGAFGLLNLGAAIWLVRRGHIAGWFTLFPLVALTTPMVALPFANMLAASDVSRIVTFHRMLFAVPSGLALCCWLNLYLSGPSDRNRTRNWGFCGLVAALLALVAISPAAPGLNRFWNLISVVPADLQLAGPVARLSDPVGFSDHRTPTTPVTPAALMNLSVTINPRAFQFRDRPIWDVPADSLRESIGMLEVSQPPDRREEALLMVDTTAAGATAWKDRGETAHTMVKFDDRFAPAAVVQNHRGKSAEVFHLPPVAIDPNQAFRIEANVRQIDGPSAGCLFAVAWLDAQGQLLESNVAAPAGAGNPDGWLNGTYSYFGPMGKPTPRGWTLYRKSFGPGKGAHIPAEARYVRLGVLLNPQSIQGAVLQVAGIRMWNARDIASKDDGAFQVLRDPFVLLPVYQTYWSSASQAAQFSGHWSPQLVAFSLSGGRELRLKAGQLGVPVILAAPAGERWPQPDGASPSSSMSPPEVRSNN